MSVPIELAIGVGQRTPIALKDGSSATWGKSYGVAPFVSEVETSRSRAKEIYEAARLAFPSNGPLGELGTQENAVGKTRGPLSIYVRPSQGPDRTFENLFALGLLPGSDPKLARVLVVDSRHWWRFRILEKAYNVRRTSGDFRLVGGELIEVQGRERVPDYTFRRASLRLGLFEWKAREALEDSMLLLAGEGNFEIPEGLLDYDGWTDGVTLHGPGDAELNRLLGYLPGVYPYQRDDGKISFLQAFDGSESAVAEELLGQQASGSVFTAPKAPIRWRTCHVSFRARTELRANFVDLGGEDDTTAGATNAPGQEPLIFENVIPCPLYKLDLGNGRQATHGEYVPLPRFLAAFNLLKASKPKVNQSFGNLTQEDLRVCFLGKPESLRINHCLLNNAQAYDGELSLMLATILQHWRRTFRISAAWVNKVRDIRAVRAAVVDAENGSLAPATVHTDWIEQLNQQGVSYKQPDQGVQHSDYAENLGDAKASPFEVRILDADSGVFTISPQIHQQQTASNYVIGKAEGPLPTDILNDVLDFWYEVKLAKEFRVAVILSATVDSPNSPRRLYVETVSLKDACDRLGVDPPGESFGPDAELVNDLDAARFAHVDDRADEVLDRINGLDVEWPEDLIANRDSIRQLAIASAAQDLATKLDRVQGTLVVSHLPEFELTGNLRQVTYTISVLPNGHATVTSTFNFPGPAPSPRIESLLPEQTRRQVFQKVVL